jgi:hypothetical protein
MSSASLWKYFRNSRTACPTRRAPAGSVGSQLSGERIQDGVRRRFIVGKSAGRIVGRVRVNRLAGRSARALLIMSVIDTSVGSDFDHCPLPHATNPAAFPERDGLPQPYRAGVDQIAAERASPARHALLAERTLRQSLVD